MTLDSDGLLTLEERGNFLNPAPQVDFLSDFGVEFVTLQADGNLVGYEADGSVAVNFATDGTGTSAVRLQDDRNLVFFGSSGQVTASLGSYRMLSLLSGDTLLPGDEVEGEGRDSRLAMQTDGNLVLYRGETPVWASGTDGNPGAGATLQSDGNLVVYSSEQTDRVPLFNTGAFGEEGAVDLYALIVEDREVSVQTASDDTAFTALWGSNWTTDRVVAGDELDQGDRRVSADRRCTLVMQEDANLVQYCDGRAVFASGRPAPAQEPFTYSTARMQADGNLVVVRESLIVDEPTQLLFTTGTRTAGGGNRLTVQSDTNLVVQAPDDRALWSRVTGRIG